MALWQQDDMENIALTKPYIYAEKVPAIFNWEADIQPARTPEDHFSLAEAYQAELLEFATALVAEHAPDAIIDASQMVKSLKSIYRKLATDESVGGDPAQIGDYLRIRISVRGGDKAKAIRQIEDMREELIFSPRVSSYKDQFRNPCPEGGHRKLVASVGFGTGARLLKAEIQICHEDMEKGPYDKGIKELRDCERILAPLVKGIQATQLSAHWGKGISGVYYHIQGLRRSINNEVAAGLGLNTLLNPELKGRYDFAAAATPKGKVKIQDLANVWHMVGERVETAARALPKHSAMRQSMLAASAANGFGAFPGHDTVH